MQEIRFPRKILPSQNYSTESAWDWSCNQAYKKRTILCFKERPFVIAVISLLQIYYY